MLEFKLIYGKDGYERTKKLRNDVFVEEQGFRYDYDDKDDISWHIVGYENGSVIGAARMYKLSETSYKIGRVAVRKDCRHNYIGDLMMKTLQDKIVGLGAIEAVVSSQIEARGFYEYEGYEAEGDEYLEEGALHILMKKDLSKPCRRCCQITEEEK